jgi:hypothetical protein
MCCVRSPFVLGVTERKCKESKHRVLFRVRRVWGSAGVMVWDRQCDFLDRLFCKQIFLTLYHTDMVQYVFWKDIRRKTRRKIREICYPRVTSLIHISLKETKEKLSCKETGSLKTFLCFRNLFRNPCEAITFLCRESKYVRKVIFRL